MALLNALEGPFMGAGKRDRLIEDLRIFAATPATSFALLREAAQDLVDYLAYHPRDHAAAEAIEGVSRLVREKSGNDRFSVMMDMILIDMVSKKGEALNKTKDALLSSLSDHIAADVSAYPEEAAVRYPEMLCQFDNNEISCRAAEAILKVCAHEVHEADYNMIQAKWMAKDFLHQSAAPGAHMT